MKPVSPRPHATGLRSLTTLEENYERPIRTTALAAAAAPAIGSIAALAQQQGSIGMDEIHASLSAESGDWADADRAQNEAMMRMSQYTRNLNDQVTDLQRRISALEQC